MTKREILNEFAQNNGFISPDELRSRLHWALDRRSVYTYLLRLARQGLLERGGIGRRRLVYRLTDRGKGRLEYLKHRR
jgi:DNA-binding PadR family transcriptional regulator